MYPVLFHSLFEVGMAEAAPNFVFHHLVTWAVVGGMSYKAVVNTKRVNREEAIKGTTALTTRELSQEEQRITSSSGTSDLNNPRSLF